MKRNFFIIISVLILTILACTKSEEAVTLNTLATVDAEDAIEATAAEFYCHHNRRSRNRRSIRKCNRDRRKT